MCWLRMVEEEAFALEVSVADMTSPLMKRLLLT